MSKKTGSKAKKAVITVLIVLVALVAIVFIGARIYFRAPVSSYYKASEKAFVIPGESYCLYSISAWINTTRLLEPDSSYLWR